MKASEKIDKYLKLVRELKKNGNMKMTVILIVVGALETWKKRIGNQWKNRKHSDYSIFKIG